MEPYKIAMDIFVKHYDFFANDNTPQGVSRGCVKTLLFLKNHKALTFTSQGFAMSKSCCNFRP